MDIKISEKIFICRIFIETNSGISATLFMEAVNTPVLLKVNKFEPQAL